MNILPKGYYAVKSDIENSAKDVFVYKGITYGVKEGENLFATLHEAMAAATEIPTEIIGGLTYSEFASPVILLSAGAHKVDKLMFDRSLTILGEGAEIDPNLSTENKLDEPLLNPLREGENETVIWGSFYYGRNTISNGSNVPYFVMDGVSSRSVGFRDVRNDADGEVYVSMRNIVHISPCNTWLYYFSNPKKDGKIKRTVELRNVRASGFDDYGYGTSFALVSAEKAIFDGICYTNTEQNFGFTDMPREKSNIQRNVDLCEYVIKNSYFANFMGINGVATSAYDAEDTALKLTVKDSVFVNACRVGESPLNIAIPNKKSSLAVESCTFVDTRNNNVSAVSVMGNDGSIEIKNCEFDGLSAAVNYKPPIERYAPDYIDNREEDWTTDTEDSHTVVGVAKQDFSALDALYEGRRAYYGDQHVHTSCGGTSDGSFPMSEWVKAMDEKQVDFAIVVDHRQMRGFFLPEWSEERFVIGTEPATKLTDLECVRFGNCEIHYNMLFPHKYGLAMVLANFPEFEFCGDELTGKFKYPKFTKERFFELTKYVQSIGGMMVHPHPKTMLASDNPMDYYIGEHTYLETIYGSRSSSATFKNYDLWVEILAEGKRVYASSGSDTHGAVSNAALSTFYTQERSGIAFFNQMKTGDYTVGEIGMKMCIDGSPMGSEIEYKDGMKLTLRIDDLFGPAKQEDTVYELRVVTDKGVAYSSRFNGEKPQAIELEVKKRMFYRAEIFDVTHNVWFAHGNPIWLD